MADRQSSKTTDNNGRTNGRSERNDGGSTHVTTFVNIPGVGSLRSSYDQNKSTGEISGQHITSQPSKDSSKK